MPVPQPNILVITAHDSGAHYGCYGAGVATPAIDALAGDGVRCTRMFAVAPICSPSRGSLLTGQCPQRHGMMGLAGGPWAWELTDPQRHLSHVARRNGYGTHLFGHQHDTDYVERLGFDQLHQYLSPHNRDPQINAPNIARAFAEFVATRDAGKPFYAQMGFFESHTPWNFGGAVPTDGPVPEWCQQDDDATRKRVAALNGAMRRVDDAVAIVTNALRTAGIERDTLVLVNTDHGPELPRGKWTMLDGGLRIGFVVRYPAGGITGGRTCELLLSNADFLPTLAELTGLHVDHAMDGVSVAATWRGGSAGSSVRDETHHISVDSEYAVRTDRFKLIRRFRGERIEGLDATGRPNLIPAARLFDLVADPLELNNVIDDPAYAKAYGEMHDRLWRHLEAVGDPILRGAVATPFYEKSIRAYHTWRAGGASELEVNL